MVFFSKTLVDDIEAGLYSAERIFDAVTLGQKLHVCFLTVSFASHCLMCSADLCISIQRTRLTADAHSCKKGGGALLSCFHPNIALGIENQISCENESHSFIPADKKNDVNKHCAHS